MRLSPAIQVLRVHALNDTHASCERLQALRNRNQMNVICHQAESRDLELVQPAEAMEQR
jgi:hypothetical protein